MAVHRDYHRTIFVHYRPRYVTFVVYVSPWSKWSASIKEQLTAFLQNLADDLEDRERRASYVEYGSHKGRDGLFLHVPRRYEDAAVAVLRELPVQERDSSRVKVLGGSGGEAP